LDDLHTCNLAHLQKITIGFSNITYAKQLVKAALKFKDKGIIINPVISVVTDDKKPIQLADAKQLGNDCLVQNIRCLLSKGEFGGIFSCFDHLRELVFDIDHMGVQPSLPLKSLKDTIMKNEYLLPHLRKIEISCRHDKGQHEGILIA
jgi:hypothetical protein